MRYKLITCGIVNEADKKAPTASSEGSIFNSLSNLADTLEDKVNRALAEGATLVGGVAFCGNTAVQAVLYPEG